MCFHGEIRKILSGYPSYWSGAMNTCKGAKLRVNIFSVSLLLNKTDDRLWNSGWFLTLIAGSSNQASFASGVRHGQNKNNAEAVHTGLERGWQTWERIMLRSCHRRNTEPIFSGKLVKIEFSVSNFMKFLIKFNFFLIFNTRQNYLWADISVQTPIVSKENQ